MQTMTAGVRSLSLLLELSWDRLLYGAAVGGALFGAAWLVSMIA